MVSDGLILSKGLWWYLFLSRDICATLQPSNHRHVRSGKEICMQHGDDHVKGQAALPFRPLVL